MLQDVNSQLNNVTQYVGTMAASLSASMAREAAQEDPQQKSKEKAISELARLSFTGSEIVEAATVFAKAPHQMNMMLALPENLRREYVLKMLFGILLLDSKISFAKLLSALITSTSDWLATIRICNLYLTSC